MGIFGGKIAKITENYTSWRIDRVSNNTNMQQAASPQPRNTNDAAVLQYESGGVTPIMIVYWPLYRHSPRPSAHSYR